MALESDHLADSNAVVRDAAVSATAVGSFVVAAALILGAGATDQFFPWVVGDPLTALIMGAGFAAGGVLLVGSVNANSWTVTRIATVPMFVLFACGLWAGYVESPSISDVESPVLRIATSYMWLPLNGFAAIGAAALFFLAGAEEPSAKVRALPLVARAGLLAHGAALALLGANLLRDPLGHADWIPWQTKALDLRELGCWALALAAAELWCAFDGELAHFRPAIRGLLVFGVLGVGALLLLHGHVRPSHDLVPALLAVGSLVVVALIGLALDTGRAPREEAASPAD